MCRIIISLDTALQEEWEGADPAAALLTEIDIASSRFEVCRLFNGGAYAEILIPEGMDLEKLSHKYSGTFIFTRKLSALKK